MRASVRSEALTFFFFLLIPDEICFPLDKSEKTPLLYVALNVLYMMIHHYPSRIHVRWCQIFWLFFFSFLPTCLIFWHSCYNRFFRRTDTGTSALCLALSPVAVELLAELFIHTYVDWGSRDMNWYDTVLKELILILILNLYLYREETLNKSWLKLWNMLSHACFMPACLLPLHHHKGYLNIMSGCVYTIKSSLRGYGNAGNVQN